MKNSMDIHKTALLIRGTMVIRGVKQKDLAKKIGISRQYLNLFLNRKIDLLPKDIEAILKELGLENQAARLSAPITINP